MPAKISSTCTAANVSTLNDILGTSFGCPYSQGYLNVCDLCNTGCSAGLPGGCYCGGSWNSTGEYCNQYPYISCSAKDAAKANGAIGGGLTCNTWGNGGVCGNGYLTATTVAQTALNTLLSAPHYRCIDNVCTPVKSNGSYFGSCKAICGRSTYYTCINNVCVPSHDGRGGSFEECREFCGN